MKRRDKTVTFDALTEFCSNVLRQRREELGLTQSEVAAQLGVGQAQISRLEEYGQRPKTQARAAGIAEVYQLTKAQRDEFFTLLYGPVISTTLRYDDLLEEYRADVQHMYDLRLEGFPQAAVRLGDDKAKRIQQHISVCPIGRVTYQLHSILAHIYFQQAVAYTETHSEAEVVRNVERLYREMLTLAERTGSVEIRSWAEHRMGTAYYIAGQYQRSVQHLLEAISTTKDINCRLWIYRTLALNFARLGQADIYLKTEGAIRTLCRSREELKDELQCITLEALGRCRAILKVGDPFPDLMRAEELYARLRQQDRRALFRRTQIVRSELEVVRLTGTKDISNLEQKAKDCIVLAKEAGYTRHVSQMQHDLQCTFA
jgi:transcriptional regulator with XRE-family HTH domain